MLFLLSLFSNQVCTVSITMVQQGRLLDNNGYSVQLNHYLTFRLYENPSVTRPLCLEGLSVFFENGFYNVIHGDDNSNFLDTYFGY